MKRTKITIAAGTAVAGIGLAFLLSHPNYRQVTERPAEMAAPTGQPLKETSVVSFTATFPYETLTKALNTGIKPAYNFEGRKELCGSLSNVVANGIKNNFGGDGAKILGGAFGAVIAVGSLGATENKCFHGDYYTTVSRTGDFATGLNGDAFHISVPLKLDGHVGLAGDIAKTFAMDKKNVRGEVTLYADVRMKIDENWCPTVEVTPTFRWTDGAKIELLGKTWGALDKEADTALRDAVSDAQRMLPSLLTCDFVKQKISPYWKAYAFELPKNAVEGQIAVTPKRIGLSSIANKPEGLQVSFMMEAETEVLLADKVRPDAKGQPPVDVTPGQVAHTPSPAAVNAAETLSTSEATRLVLPKLTQIPSGTTGFKLAAPISVPYPVLQELVRKVVMEKPYNFKTKVADGEITVKDLVAYPAGERLVIGLKFDSSLSHFKSLAPNGWVYLTAKPAIDEAKSELRLTQVSYARTVDNDLWNSVSYVFQGPIKALIESKVAFDLNKIVKPMQDDMRAKVADGMRKNGIQATWKDLPVKLSRLEILRDGLQVVAKLDGAADFVVQPPAVDAAMKLMAQTPPPPAPVPPPVAVAPAQPAKEYTPLYAMESPRTWRLSR